MRTINPVKHVQTFDWQFKCKSIKWSILDTCCAVFKFIAFPVLIAPVGDEFWIKRDITAELFPHLSGLLAHTRKYKSHLLVLHADSAGNSSALKSSVAAQKAIQWCSYYLRYGQKRSLHHSRPTLVLSMFWCRINPGRKRWVKIQNHTKNGQYTSLLIDVADISVPTEWKCLH